MRNEVLDFAFGFVPMAITGIALTFAGGRVTAVYCGTYTPVPRFNCVGLCPGGPCVSLAWIPYWNGMYFLVAGAFLGLIMMAAGAPLPRGSHPRSDLEAPSALTAGGPGQSSSTTTCLLGADTMPLRVPTDGSDPHPAPGRPRTAPSRSTLSPPARPA